VAAAALSVQQGLFTVCVYSDIQTIYFYSVVSINISVYSELKCGRVASSSLCVSSPHQNLRPPSDDDASSLLGSQPQRNMLHQ